MKLKFIYLFLILTNLTFGQSDNLNPGLTKIVNDIAQNNELLSEAIGIDGTSTDQYKRFEILKEKATIKQLTELTNHENAVVRSYAFWVLSDRKSDNLYPILKKHLNDTIKLERQFGCVVSDITVADFYIELLTNDYLITEDYLRENHSFLNKKDKKSLDSLVLHTPNKLEYLNAVLLKHEPNNEMDYLRIKELANKGNYIALPALAKYQKLDDIKLILSFTKIPEEPNMYPHPYKCIFQAMESFPNNGFNDFLNYYGNVIIDDKAFSSYWLDFYNTCAKYDTKTSIEILSKPTNKELKVPMRKYHLRFINRALGKYPSKNNKQLIIDLWKQYKLIDEGSFNYLKKENPKLTFEIIKDYMRDFEDVYNGGNEEKLIPIIIPFALEYDEEITLEIIANNIKTNTITPFEEWSKIAKELKKEEFIEPLFDRIDSEWNSYVKFEAVRVLLAYNRKDIDNRLVNTLNNKLENKDKYKSVAELREIMSEWDK